MADGLHIPTPSSPSIWERVSTWASENKAVAYTIAGTVVVVTGAGVVYYLSESKSSKPKSSPGEKRKSKKQRQKGQANAQGEGSTITLRDEEAAREVPSKQASVADEDAAPELTAEDLLRKIDESTVDDLSVEDRKTYAAKLKAAGNRSYSAKDYEAAIGFYSKAILCRPDPVYYSNRAACYSNRSEWPQVVEDTTASLAMDPEYLKPLNRRAHAYEHQGMFSEALLDYTASCIIDGFRNHQSAESVERLLKKVAEKKGKAILEAKGRRLPSPTFVTNYLQSFRAQPPPDGLESADESTGLGQLQKGFAALEKKTSEGYEEASTAFEKAIQLNDLGQHEALGLNLRATFRYLEGDMIQALEDLSKSIELEPTLTQSYIKRASLHLEMSNREVAAEDFEKATAQNPDDPDIFYHRAQLHFLQGEFPEAAKDYQKSIDLDPTFIYSHIQLGVTQYKMGSIASSMSTFRRTIKKFDRVPDVYNYYGELLIDQQKYQEAIEKFDTAVDMEKQSKPMSMNVLPLINKALALFQWKQDYKEAESLCQKALIIDPECDIAVATMAQLLLQQGKVVDALKYFEKAAELSRTEGEIVNALSYAEATRTQLEVSQRYPQLAQRLQQMGAPPGMPGR